MTTDSVQELIIFDNKSGCGMVDRVPAFQSDISGSILSKVRNVNFYPGTVCVSFVFCTVLSLAMALTFC